MSITPEQTEQPADGTETLTTPLSPELLWAAANAVIRQKYDSFTSAGKGQKLPNGRWLFPILVKFAGDHRGVQAVSSLVLNADGTLNSAPTKELLATYCTTTASYLDERLRAFMITSKGLAVPNPGPESDGPSEK